jgi:hypothetical protein
MAGCAFLKRSCLAWACYVGLIARQCVAGNLARFPGTAGSVDLRPGCGERPKMPAELTPERQTHHRDGPPPAQ